MIDMTNNKAKLISLNRSIWVVTKVFHKFRINQAVDAMTGLSHGRALERNMKALKKAMMAIQNTPRVLRRLVLIESAYLKVVKKYSVKVSCGAPPLLAVQRIEGNLTIVTIGHSNDYRKLKVESVIATVYSKR